MSWSRSAAAVVLLLLGAGCGFRPMYAPVDDRSVLQSFAGIDVAVIEDRIGQQLRNELLDLLTPRGRPPTPEYVLSVETSESTRKLAVRRTGLATRAELVVGARFTLTTATGETLLSQQTSATSSYNLLDSDYATLIAARDAQARAVKLIAEDIRNRLGVYFSAGGTAPAAG